MRNLIERRGYLLPMLAAIALALGACSGNSTSDTSTPTTPTTPTPTPTLISETFTGTVAQGGTVIHPFAVKSSGSLLAGYTAITPTTITSLGLGIGVWDGTASTCGLNLSQADAAKPGSTAISGTANAANYCLRVYDGGNIPAGTTVSYSVQVQHY